MKAHYCVSSYGFSPELCLPRIRQLIDEAVADVPLSRELGAVLNVAFLWEATGDILGMTAAAAHDLFSALRERRTKFSETKRGYLKKILAAVDVGLLTYKRSPPLVLEII